MQSQRKRNILETAASEEEDSSLYQQQVKERRRKQGKFHKLDRDSGFEPLLSLTGSKVGWLFNAVATTVEDPTNKRVTQAVDLFFIGADGNHFRATMICRPYFYLKVKEGSEEEVEFALKKYFRDKLYAIKQVALHDQSVPNHVASMTKRSLLAIEFRTMSELNEVSSFVLRRLEEFSTSRNLLLEETKENEEKLTRSDGFHSILEIFEYDISPISRTMISQNIHVGLWYNVRVDSKSNAVLHPLSEIVERPQPVVLAFDIETTKAPLKFPDAKTGDQVMMISWMIDGKGYLGVNREIVAANIDDFTYSPKDEFPGDFTVFNENDERSLLLRFLDEIQLHTPQIFVTYNGDMFDWPFVFERARYYDIDIEKEIGISCNQRETRGRATIHLDCMHWVNRDSYLPQGSRGLKAVTRSLLGYDPLELDPEEMMPAARSNPQLLASYSVSDAVCTYYLYMRYVHPFIFSLCNIVPLPPEDVLRRGSGTLCENLLMKEAYQQDILCPNKHQTTLEKYYDGHLLENETYIGGHVEALQAGVFRSDLSVRFSLSEEVLGDLTRRLDEILQHAMNRLKVDPSKVTNYVQLSSSLTESLKALKHTHAFNDFPVIYHLDVGAMYPNVILTNRLQPHAIVSKHQCASCAFNELEDSQCKRNLKWTWKGEYFPATHGETNQIRRDILSNPNGNQVENVRSSEEFRRRLKQYCQKIYKKTLDSYTEEREATVCQREHPFYVNTVRAFRDRRYEYKKLLKQWKRKLQDAQGNKDWKSIEEAKKMCVLYESLQLAHKCILNSFYGYVMRKAARWYSMEMAGVVTQIGANIIRYARSVVDGVGIALELDTDGIWCALPKSFPEKIVFQTHDQVTYESSFICEILNYGIFQQFSNPQYQSLVNTERKEFERETVCSIEFEFDGPYRAMILPASKEEGKSIKKRYAVFHMDGSMAELKGFEMKRRGELKLIKIFQSDLFQRFLLGETLEECYQKVGEAANNWLEVLETQGASCSEQEIIELLAEQNTMSKSLGEYLKLKQKSLAITTAKRLAEFLGPQMVRDKGLACKYVIARKPENAQVTERAIPIQIFSAEQSIRESFLKKWLKETDSEAIQLREFLDWQYYKERLASTIQKIITIPAAFQSVENPVPRVAHPEWLSAKLRDISCRAKQSMVADFFAKSNENSGFQKESMPDLEDISVVRMLSLSQRTKQIENVSASEEMAQNDNLRAEDKPNIQKSFYSWLVYMRNIWRLERRNKVVKRVQKRQHENFESRYDKDVLPPSRQRQRKDIRRFIAPDPTVASEEFQLQTELHILSIQATETPGEFQIWILPRFPQDTRTDKPLEKPFSCFISSKRTLYVNCRQPSSRAIGPQIFNVRLPRYRKPCYLYQVEVEESAFLRQQNELNDLVPLSEVEGIYETQVPLLTNICQRLGNVCKVKDSATFGHMILGDKVDIQQIEPISSKQEYLGHLSNPEEKAFLYVCLSITKERGLIALTVPYLNKIWLCFISIGQQCPHIELHRLLEESCSAAFLQEVETSSWQVESSVFKGYQEALKTLSMQASESLKSSSSLLCILFVQSSLPPWALSKYFRCTNVTPVSCVDYMWEDSQFPVIGWEVLVVKQFLRRNEHIILQARHLLSFARISQIPVGNISMKDPYSQCLDMNWAQDLRKNNFILWMSDRAVPDLGGHESEYQLHDLLELREPSVEEKEYLLPGLYENICVEFELQNVALCTILSQDILSEMEGSEIPFVTDLFQNFDKELDSSSNEEAVGYEKILPAFSVLRQTLLRLFSNVNKSFITETLQNHLLRWILKETSLMYEPLLVSFVQHQMHKVLVILVNSLKQLGAIVPLATYHRMIIATKRSHAMDAMRYCGFLANTIRENQLFHYLRFAPILFVHRCLILVDSFNYGSIPVVDEIHILRGEALKGYIESERPASRMQWDLADHFTTDLTLRWNRILEQLLENLHSGSLVCVDSTEEKKNNNNIPLASFVSNLRQELYNLVNDSADSYHMNGVPPHPGRLIGSYQPIVL
ncbi:DNA polymerase epsilon subunit 1 [Galdieria sulphuraria]|uniref:DNA polymerase epsilon catalytic subunit n=1 Tax=Galdieria sulphuraria TaxID=130081 RepID=M2X793_GALSU|nr:DNA polymerase epsilon subunit 1 [Galdieria sulphuraria]EME32355.1 DNA polymerase epsilon subunit 1 [Galdieria sulphuraria]|eukprot:XP_005708875.1 DNA polymerase epsilon subunit 1 [Galdieria sulphuraria]